MRQANTRLCPYLRLFLKGQLPRRGDHSTGEQDTFYRLSISIAKLLLKQWPCQRTANPAEWCPKHPSWKPGTPSLTEKATEPCTDTPAFETPQPQPQPHLRTEKCKFVGLTPVPQSEAQVGPAVWKQALQVFRCSLKSGSPLPCESCLSRQGGAHTCS